MNTVYSWSALQKWAFRFLTLYLIIYIFPIPIHGLVTQLASLFVENPEIQDVFNNNLYLIFHTSTVAVLSLLLSLAWSALDRSRQNYSTLLYWVILLMRAFLFINMMVYGFAKVFLVQFGFPPLLQLLQPLGELTPMRLAWNFIGYSDAYQFFAGLLEVIGGFLLLFRRTSTLGALIIFGVMSNVALMNFAYNIPVKSLSAHLALFALILATFDHKRLLNFFFLNRPVEPMQTEAPVKYKWYGKITGLASKAMAAGLILLLLTSPIIRGQLSFFTLEKPELYGIYQTEMMERNGEVMTSTDLSKYWNYFVVDYKNQSSILYLDGHTENFTLTTDSTESAFRLKSTESEEERGFYFNVEDEHLSLHSTTGPDSLSIKLSKVRTAEKFNLIK
ncbi:MAG: hypothetical protein WD016_11190 [Balneolaceae bacterium]